MSKEALESKAMLESYAADAAWDTLVREGKWVGNSSLIFEYMRQRCNMSKLPVGMVRIPHKDYYSIKIIDDALAERLMR